MTSELSKPISDFIGAICITHFFGGSDNVMLVVGVLVVILMDYLRNKSYH